MCITQTKQGTTYDTCGPKCPNKGEACLGFLVDRLNEFSKCEASYKNSTFCYPASRCYTRDENVQKFQ